MTIREFLGAIKFNTSRDYHGEEFLTADFLILHLGRNFVDFDTSQRDSLLIPIFQNKSLEAENTLRGDLVYKLSANSELNFGFNYKLIKFKADILLPTFKTSFGDSLPNTSLNAK